MSISLRPIGIGDFSPTIRLQNENGANVWAYDTALAGHPAVYVIFRDLAHSKARETLAALKERYSEYEEVGAKVVAITNLFPDDNANLIGEMDLPFPVLSDVSASYANSYKMSSNNGAIGCAVLDRNCRLLKFLEGPTGNSAAEQALKICRREAASGSKEQIMTQAPVLLVPRVFEPDFCKQLISHWRKGDKAEDQITRRAEGNASDRTNDLMKRRTDVLIQENEPINSEIRRRLSMRAVPELEKAFNHKTSRYELARIGCYESSKKGFFRAHRDLYHGDNVNPRRFAMSINLNDNFDGGDVRFPEYGMQSYRASLGGGLIFSCRLLHEVLPVTKGKRYTLLLFFK